MSCPSNSLIHCCRISYLVESFPDVFDILDILFDGNLYLIGLIVSYLPDERQKRKHYINLSEIHSYWSIHVYWRLFDFTEQKEYWRIERTDRFAISRWFYSVGMASINEFKRSQYLNASEMMRIPTIHLIEITTKYIKLENYILPTTYISSIDNEEDLAVMVLEYDSE